MSLFTVARLRLFACICAVLILIGAQGIGAQEAAEVSGPVDAPDAPSADTTCTTGLPDDFDFWLGTWRLMWDGGRGTNRVRRILGGCVVEERFSGRMKDGSTYRGRSYTAYDASEGVWKQTWVDDRGGYLDFIQDTSGTTADPAVRMVLRRTTRGNSPSDSPRTKGLQHHRMVWRDVKADRLTWYWQRRTPADTAWTTLWAITYARDGG